MSHLIFDDEVIILIYRKSFMEAWQPTQSDRIAFKIHYSYYLNDVFSRPYCINTKLETIDWLKMLKRLHSKVGYVTSNKSGSQGFFVIEWEISFLGAQYPPNSTIRTTWIPRPIFEKWKIERRIWINDELAMQDKKINKGDSRNIYQYFFNDSIELFFSFKIYL